VTILDIAHLFGAAYRRRPSQRIVCRISLCIT